MQQRTANSLDWDEHLSVREQSHVKALSGRIVVCCVSVHLK